MPLIRMPHFLGLPHEGEFKWVSISTNIPEMRNMFAGHANILAEVKSRYAATLLVTNKKLETVYADHTFLCDSPNCFFCKYLINFFP